MKNILLFSFILITNTVVSNGQKSEIIGKWQLCKVVINDNTYEDLKDIYIFEEDGVLKAARSAASKAIEVGTWKFKKRKQAIMMKSTLDKDFNGKATLVRISGTELVYKKDKAILHFRIPNTCNAVSNIDSLQLREDNKSKKEPEGIERLTFIEADFYNEDGDYKYYDDEEKLPWQDKTKMLMSLVNVTQLVYKFSKLDEETMIFKNKILKADVNSIPSEQSLSIDYIFNGYDRYNLPDDTALQQNTEYSNPLYPEELNTFRVSGVEIITTLAGTFKCTVVELAGIFDSCKKLWMINDKPGIYAKIITDKPGSFGKYTIHELQEIKMK